MTRASLFRSRIVAASLLIALGAASWWAFKPLPMPNLTIPTFNSAPLAPAPEQLAAMDTTAFSTPLWVAPPAPPAPPVVVAAPPLPPLKLQLIAITRDGSTPDSPLSVLVYDPDTDRLLTLKQGETIAGRTIERITTRAVELREGSSIRTLVLADSPSGGSPSGVAR